MSLMEAGWMAQGGRTMALLVVALAPVLLALLLHIVSRIVYPTQRILLDAKPYDRYHIVVRK
ncbi:MAG: hypothetical protein ABIH11_05345 [Candidatus Altiarchaeota archaeon]